MMKIAVVQMSASIEAPLMNEEKIHQYILDAAEAEVHLICFPEMALIGYGFENLEERVKTQNATIQRLQVLAKTYHMTLLVGGIEYDEILDDYYIAQYVINDHIETYRKIHIGQKEGAYVASGESIKTFEVDGLKFGIMLCYDGHFPELCTIMAAQGAKLIFNPSASPNKPSDRLRMWEKYLIARAYDNRQWLIGNNLRFNGKGGGMMVVDSDGVRVDQCELEADHMMVVEYVATDYRSGSMKKRDFALDRRDDIYRKYL